MRLAFPGGEEVRSHPVCPDESALQPIIDRYAPDMDVRRFLALFAPLEIFERVFADPPAALAYRSFAWLLQVSGYFAGRSARRLIVEAQVGSPLHHIEVAVTRNWPELVADYAEGGHYAAFADGDEPLEFCEGVLPELVSVYGYNLGFAMSLIEGPPAGTVAPRGFLVPAGPLWCGYARPKLEALEDLYDVRRKLVESHDPDWSHLGEWIHAEQQAGVEQGQRWSDLGLNFEGVSQEDYAQILEATSGFLEVVQATALLAVRSLAESDARGARRVALASSLISSWRHALPIGAADDRFDLQPEANLPIFED